jgi:hypothetical protein
MLLLVIRVSQTVGHGSQVPYHSVEYWLEGYYFHDNIFNTKLGSLIKIKYIPSKYVPLIAAVFLFLFYII